MRSYGAARSYFSILEFLSWCIIVLGGLVAIGSIMALGQMSRNFGGTPMAGLAGLIPGASVMFAGFMGLVLAQIGRAGVDSAEYGQQGLKIAREQLEISKQRLKQGVGSEAGFGALQAAKDELRNGASFADKVERTDGPLPEEPSDPDIDAISGANKVIEYRGRKIGDFGRMCKVGQDVFWSLEAAKAAVDAVIDAEDAAKLESGGGPPDRPRLGGVTRS